MTALPGADNHPGPGTGRIRSGQVATGLSGVAYLFTVIAPLCGPLHIHGGSCLQVGRVGAGLPSRSIFPQPAGRKNPCPG